MLIAEKTLDLTPDRAAMLAHLEHLFGGFIEGAHDGLVEISWTETKPDQNGRYSLRHAQLFGIDQLEDAAEFAWSKNSTPMCNVYVGGALRHPNTAPFGRGNDDDFMAATALWCDLDSEDAARNAKTSYADLKPTFVVMTGSHPHNRVQCWWRLTEVMDDADRLRNALSGLAHRMGGDTTVVNASRVMRLAGTIAWPQKSGRVAEVTKIIALKEPGLASYMPEHVEKVFPPVHSLAAHRERRQADGGDGAIVRERGALGFDTGKIVDGRERYMRNVILAHLVEYVGTNGAEPDADELFDTAWPVYASKVSLDRPGRGQDEFREKCQYTARRFVEGKIPGLRSIEAAVDAYGARRAARDACGPVETSSPAFDYGQAEVAAAERYKFETIADLRLLPPAQWLVKDWIPAGGTGILYGKWATGKSFLSFDLALHLAYGLPDWHGVPLPEDGVDVLVIAREGHQGFIQRIDAFKKHHQITDDTDRLHFMRGSVSFMRDEEFKALLDAIAAQPVQYSLTIVDTVARVLAGVDMNAQETVTTFMERCSTISSISGAATIGVHHQNKAGSMMGSIYFEANSDFVFEVTRDGDDEEPGPLRSGEILCTKMKDGEDGWKRSVRYETVGLTPESGSLVVAEIGGAPTKKSVPLPPKETCRRILHAIDEAWRSGRPLNHNYQAQRRGGKYAQRILSEQFRMKAEAVERLLIAWLDNDVISFEQVSTKTKMMGLRVIGSID